MFCRLLIEDPKSIPTMILHLLNFQSRVAMWFRYWTSPACDAHGLLGNATLQHDLLLDESPAIYNTMNRSLASTMACSVPQGKLDECGGFFKRADMERGLLFAIRAR